MRFRVRQKVQCIAKPSQIARHYGEAIPELGSIYTVRSKHECDGVYGIRLVEIKNPEHPYWDGTKNSLIEIAFAEELFKPFTKTRVSRKAAVPADDAVMA